MRQPLLKHQHIVKLGRLLDMLYKPSELAEEIGVTTDTIYRSYLPAGLPHTRDEMDNIWIHGPAFVEWAKLTVSRRKPHRVGLPEDQTYCLKCKEVVPFLSPTKKSSNRYTEMWQSTCPQCGRRINRVRRRSHDQPSELA
jgi:uncharacterized protein DUF5679